MGCFMGCFGLSSNKKRTRKILPRNQRICSYEPLHSSDPTDFSTNIEKIPNLSLSHEVNEEEEKKDGTKKTIKRVRFNLNVQTYEPIPPTRYENDCTESKGETTKESPVFDKKPEDLSSGSLYPNYRYHNCVDSFEDEDELGLESDLEDEDYYTDDESNNEEDVDQDVTTLLNPVVNLAQWKVVKAKPVKVVKQEMKENFEEDMDDQAKPLLKEIVVNTSLSNWLASPKSSLKRSSFVDITNMGNR